MNRNTSLIFLWQQRKPPSWFEIMYRWPTSSPPSPDETSPDPPRPRPSSNGLGVFTWRKARNTHSQKMAFVGLKICALALFLLLGAAAEDERKPNIVFMLMDDVSKFYITCSWLRLLGYTSTVSSSFDVLMAQYKAKIHRHRWESALM